MLNEKPANVLTEEELKSLISKLIYDIKSDEGLERFKRVIDSHRTLNSRNAKLVHENDELMAENVKLKEAKKIYEKALGLIADAYYEGPAGALKWRDVANNALEAFDHE